MISLKYLKGSTIYESCFPEERVEREGARAKRWLIALSASLYQRCHQVEQSFLGAWSECKATPVPPEVSWAPTPPSPSFEKPLPRTLHSSVLSQA